ncbi:MAG TPA: amino acid adenylation domain-containing protein [Opitutaceae bacterium]
MLLQQCLTESANVWPERAAVRMRETVLTYAQLDARSNRIARALRTAGVKARDRVGIYLSKSPAAVAAIFGALKAGAAYVPLDVDSPGERTAYVVGNGELAAVITDARHGPKLAGLGVPVLLSVDGTIAADAATGAKFSDEWVSAQPGEPLESDTVEDDLAYILYTSGSTGRPKGVMLSHRNAMVFIDWSLRYLEIGDGERFASHAPFHFDLSIFDLYVALKTGGTLCLVPPGFSYFPDALARFVADHAITVWYSVPSAIIQILSHPHGLVPQLRSIRTLIYAGEVFPYKYLNDLRRALPETRLYNFYGPTETNVITAHRLAGLSHGELTADVPIGAACDYAHIEVVDTLGRRVLPGREGELVVKGGSLMQGYWRDPERTRAAIRPLTLDGETEDFYFTGDIVTCGCDGEFVYRGRRDNMVKTRGFRVELGEIETVVAQHAAVQQCAVLAIPDERISHRLHAVVSFRPGAEAGIDALLEHCGRFLPGYMLPEGITVVEAMPLTSTGKTDRTSLSQLINNAAISPPSLDAALAKAG